MIPWAAAGWVFAAANMGCARQDWPEDERPGNDAPDAGAEHDGQAGHDGAGGAGGDAQTGASGGDALDNLPPSGNPDTDAGFTGGSAGSGSASTGGFMIPDFSGIDFGGDDDDAAVPALTDAAPQSAGALVVSELIANPVGSTGHEWLELYNPSDKTFNLLGCTLASSSGEHAIYKDVFIAPGSYVVLARDNAAQDGVAALYIYADVSFSSSSDDVSLTCGQVVIDSLHYETELTERAQSTQLSASLLDASANDKASAWCLGTSPIGVSENQGTPGAANRNCP